MFFILLNHQWKSFIRSRNTGKSIAIQILVGFLFLYLLACVTVLGLSFGHILKANFPKQDITKIFCGFILYYFLIDILIRFFLQDLPTITIQPYLTLNIKHKTLIGFLNLRSVFSIFNLLPIVLFVPFVLTNIASQYGSAKSICFIVDIIALCLGNHFLVLFIKKKTFVSSWWLAGFFMLIIAFIVCDYFGLFSIRNFSETIFYKLLWHPWLATFTILWALMCFYNNYSFLRKSLYLEEDNGSAVTGKISNYNWLQNFGMTGELLAIELKMILRNKRPRSLLIISMMFMLYGFAVYKPEFLNKDHLGFILLGALMITGIFMANYGQFLFAWQSAHFDGTMINNAGIKTYIRSKFFLMISISTIALLFSLLYGFISWKIIPVEIAAYCFNIGIQPVIAGLLAPRNYKGLDISKKATFNYQGVGASQWLYSLAIFLIALMIYWPFTLLFNEWSGIIAIGITGLIFLLLQAWWIDIIAKQFEKNKYKILAGFREK